MSLRLSFACGLYDRVLPLYTGEVRPEGIELDFRVMEDPREIFDRMARGGEFDAAEMSGSEYVSRVAANECPFVAIPVFPSRVFRHGFITINARSGIRTPRDLEGRRVGVPLYTMSAAVWIRGHLQHEYGVDLSTIHWVQGKINQPGAHGNPAVMPMLRKVDIEDNTTGKSLSQLLDEGRIDAIAGTDLPESIRRNPDVRRLFPDFRAVEREYYLRTRIFPVMHLVVIRREVHEKNPFAARSLYRAFCEAKANALAKMRYLGTLRYMLPWLTADVDEIDEVFGGDPWPYGVDANRPTLEALVQYLHEQGLIASRPRIEDLFLPVD